MMARNLRRVAGLALLVLAVIGFSVGRSLALQHAKGLVLPVYLLQAALLGAALAFLDVLRRDVPTAACAVAVAGPLCFYLLGNWAYQVAEHGDVIRLFPAEQGRLLLGACAILLVLGLWRAWRTGAGLGGGEALVQGLALLALTMLAGLVTLVNGELFDVGLWARAAGETPVKLLRYMSWGTCLFLLPLLRRGERGSGWALFLLGLVLSAFAWAMNHTALNGLVYAKGAGGVLRVLRISDLFFRDAISLYPMLAVSGLYCLLPAPRAEKDAE